MATQDPGPIDFRHYVRKYTLDDARAGTQPLRLPTGPSIGGQQPMDLFAPPVLQFRYKTKVHVNGTPTLEWSEWIDVPVVREEEPTPSPPEITSAR